MSTEFHFKTKFDQTILLGRKAATVLELLDGIRTVPDSSIYLHTHKFLHQHHFLSPEPPNDFAYWVTNVLNENALGERISSVDIIRFHTIADVRKYFVDLIEGFLLTTHRSVEAPAGEEFYFMAAQIFVLDTPHVARTLEEFIQCLETVSIHSLNYHMFDAHLRMEQEENDFSEWFREIGKPALADEVLHIDPYTRTLDGLRKKLLHIVSAHAKN